MQPTHCLCVTTSYEILGPELIKEVPGQAMIILDSLLKIYEKVQDESAWSNAEIKKYQWPVGKITGYILWSLLECVCLNGDIEQLSEAWIAYLLRIRSDRKPQ